MLVGSSQSSILNPPSSSLLYAGEQFDSDLGQYYLRARYYDPSNGRFNRLDPFEGNKDDPQSIHKYAYAHSDPANGTDPSGASFILEFTASTAIRAIIAALAFGAVSAGFSYAKGATLEEALIHGAKTAAITGFAFVSPAFALSLLGSAPAVIGLGIYNEQVTADTIPELAAYVVVALALFYFFKLPAFNTVSASGASGAAVSEPALASVLRKVDTLNFGSGPNEAVFYSGPGQFGRAADFATATGRKTIEMTPGGQSLLSDPTFQSLSKLEQLAVWRKASVSFAARASGKIHAFIKGSSQEGIFRTVEEPVLDANANVYETIYHY